MWKPKGKLMYSADYDHENGTVKTRDWREDHEKVQSKEGRGSILS